MISHALPGALRTRPDTAGHPAHHAAANQPHSPPGAAFTRGHRPDRQPTRGR
ncbi:hypothetical protein ACH4OW_28660 [Streptomyces sp. NPDC017056]|uniref:hypothetical protein n=1 Tax=Streptomyces sp. NPDC017056 TaxID=3364973 RepID=UPI0037AD6F96